MKILSVFMASAPCWAWACTAVDGPRIRGAELAAVSPVFAAVDPGFDLGPAPSLGIPRVFRVAELLRLAAHAGVTLDSRPIDVCFELTAQVLDAETLLPVLRAALALEHGNIEILDFNRNQVSRGRLEFTRAALTPSGLWRGRVADTEGRSTPVWVRVRVTDSTTGEALRLAPSATPREVERGDPVRVEVASGTVLLAFDAAAETAGRAGESVLVRNPLTGRRFRARVESKGKVILQK